MFSSCCVDDCKENESVKEPVTDEGASCCDGHTKDLRWLACVCGGFKGSVPEKSGCC